MTTENDFQAMLDADPGDHTPRALAVGMALDWLQDEHGDREACKRALYEAAAGELWDRILGEQWPNTTRQIGEAVRAGKFTAEDFPNGYGYPPEGPSEWVANMRRHHTFNRKTDSEWLAWCDCADAGLALCREIESA